MARKDGSMCEVCTALNLTRVDFEQPPFEPAGRYHSVVIDDTLAALDQRRTSCPLCQLFHHSLLKNESRDLSVLQNAAPGLRWKVEWSQSCMEYNPNREGVEDLYGSALYPYLDVDTSYKDYAVQLIDNSDTQEFLRARKIAPKLDIDTVKGWIERCAREHGSLCIPSTLHTSEHPRTIHGSFLVVDVQAQCLVELRDSQQYAALSYVWGTTNSLRTVRANVDSFKQPGALQHEVIPKTIADAMAVVQALGQQYLWIDSLCIVQDHAMKQQLIDSMDAVYSHAAFSIIAGSGGHADASLSGWADDIGRAEAVTTRTLDLDFTLGVIPNLDRDLMDSEYAQRAWTFQEGVLSRRCIIFLNSMVYYCCGFTNWREDMQAELGDLVRPYEGANVLGDVAFDGPLENFHNLLSSYTERKLTYQSDALNAFAGIQRPLAQSMDNTRFWYGLPASVFDWALLIRNSVQSTLKRRPGFPSWSWCGWEGRVVTANATDEELDYEWLITRTWIDWYIVNENSDLVLVWDPERDGTRKSSLASRRTGGGEFVLRQDEIEAREKAAQQGDEVEQEHGVEDSSADAESEKDEEQTPCPQYGWPSPGNPYGRWKLPHLQPPLAHTQVVDIVRKRSSSLTPGTLCFATLTGKFRLSQLQRGKKAGQGSFATLIDAKDGICGAITTTDSGPEANETDPQRHEVQLIALSHASPATKIPFDRLEISLSQAYQEASKHYREMDFLEWIEDEAPHVWDMFNVMLLRPGAKSSQELDIYMSAGIGLIHRDAFYSALPNSAGWEQITLT